MNSKLPTRLEMVEQLVATPSVSSVDPTLDMSNAAVIDLLANWAEGIGFRIERMPVPDDPGKVNLIATLGQGPGGLILSGHTDTVPYDAGSWETDPFTLTARDDRLHGLGSTDMKSFLAVALEAASRVRAERLREPLILLATADEESGMSGASTLVAAGRPRATSAIIGEPTGLTPIRMHKGVMMEAVRLQGTTGHSSRPDLGNNAIDGMHRVIGDLIAWREELAREWHEPAFELPIPTMNLGHIHGGDNPNRICGACELRIDMRPLPGMQLDALRGTMRRRLTELLADSGLGLEVTALFPGVPPFENAADSPLVRTLERLTGRPAEAVSFGTEGPFLQQLGIDTVVCGPGDINLAHQPNEYVTRSQLDGCSDLLDRLIADQCGL